MREGLHAVPESAMRRAIRRRMTDSKQRIPHFYLTADVEMDRCLSILASLNAERRPEERISVSAAIVHALALALKAHPRLNAVWDGETLLGSDSINIAVAIDVPEGLLAPALLGCERMDLPSTAVAMRGLIARARAGKVRAAEWSDGTFTFSNLGTIDIQAFTAIIVPPQVGILATGRIEPRAVVRDGAIVIREVMTSTLSADHRAVDGAAAARFLIEFGRRLQQIDQPFTQATANGTN